MKSLKPRNLGRKHYRYLADEMARLGEPRLVWHSRGRGTYVRPKEAAAAPPVPGLPRRGGRRP